MKNLLLFSVGVLCTFNTFSQLLTPIPSPAGYENISFGGYYGEPIVFENNLYLMYQGNNNNFDLFKYDGNTLSAIPSPAGYDATNGGYYGHPIVFENYFSNYLILN